MAQPGSSTARHCRLHGGLDGDSDAEAEASHGVPGVSSGGGEERCVLLGLGKNDLSVLRTKKRYAPLDG